MRISTTIFLALIFIYIPGYSQEKRDFQWIFGEDGGAKVDFNAEDIEVTEIDKEMEIESTSASICDTMGNLLFYTNGCYISNFNHEIIENGDSIGLGYLESSFCESGGGPLNQGAIILPAPGSENLYYVVYYDIEAPYEFPTGLYFPLAPERLLFSVVDMSLNGGAGKVISKNQVIIQDTFARSGIHAERHSNNTDWWLMIPKSHSNCYFKILLNQTGLQIPELQCTGIEWNDNDAQCQVAFSPNREKYVRFNYDKGLNIFDFDPSNGLLSNPIQISFDQDDVFNYAGVAFSSNSRFVYATTYTKVYQFDLEAANIEASKTLIAELESPPPNVQFLTYFYNALLAPDEKIYISGTNQFNHLHVIHNPNCPGAFCNLQQYAVKLDDFPDFSSSTMPNFPHFRDWNTSTICDSIIIVFPSPPESDFDYAVDSLNPFTFEFTDGSLNTPTAWLWNFGDTNTSTEQNPTHTFSGSGVYSVCLTATNAAGSDSTCQEITIQTTAIQESEDKLMLVYYPNPVREKLHLYFPKEKTLSLKKWDIYSISGELMITSGNSLQKRQTIDVSTWPNGIYSVRVIYDCGVGKIGKIIIQH